MTESLPLRAALAGPVSLQLLMPGSLFAGAVLSGLAVLMALVSFGPHNYVDPAFALIWPAVLAAHVASGCIIYRLFLAYRDQEVAA